MGGDGETGDDDVQGVLPLWVVGIDGRLTHGELRALHGPQQGGLRVLGLSLLRLLLLLQTTLLLVAQTALLVFPSTAGGVAIVLVLLVIVGCPRPRGLAVLREHIVPEHRRTHTSLPLLLRLRVSLCVVTGNSRRCTAARSNGRLLVIRTHLAFGCCHCQRCLLRSHHSRSFLLDLTLLSGRSGLLRCYRGLGSCLGISLLLLFTSFLELELQFRLWLFFRGCCFWFGCR